MNLENNSGRYCHNFHRSALFTCVRVDVLFWKGKEKKLMSFKICHNVVKFTRKSMKLFTQKRSGSFELLCILFVIEHTNDSVELISVSAKIKCF